MSTSNPAPRVLFLTPFNFADPVNDDAFDALVRRQLGDTAGAEFVADHVERFEASEADYEAVQEARVLAAVRRAEADGFDAIAIACHYDPALAAARAATSLPVIGPLQLTSSLAEQYGPQFAVISDLDEAVPYIEGLLKDYGREAGCVGVWAIGLDGDAILADTREAARRVDELVSEIAAKGNAQSVVIGCTIVSAAYEEHRSEFEDHGIRVLDSNRLTVQGAVALAR